MCFGGGGGQIQPTPAPVVTPPPEPAPQPSPIATEVSPQVTADTRRKRIAQMRHGMLSTIKTSPKGITGSGENLSAPVGGKEKLGG